MDNHYEADRSSVENTAVVARQKATLSAYNLRDGGSAPHNYPSIDEVLLADERTVYQCASPRDPNCNFTAETGESVRAHQKVHSNGAEARKLAKENAKLAAELAERKRRRVEGSIRGAETRRANGHGKVGKVGKAVELTGDTPRSADVDEIRQQLTALTDVVGRIADELDVVVRGIEAARKSVENLPAVDPAVAAKAARFDELQLSMRSILS